MPVLSTASTRTYTARIADTRDEVRAAQRLRTTVFADELGADLTPHSGPPRANPQHAYSNRQHANAGTQHAHAEAQHDHPDRQHGDAGCEHAHADCQHGHADCQHAHADCQHGAGADPAGAADPIDTDPVGTAPFDADAFDEVCDHLVVVHEPTDAVVGTYRILPPQRSPIPYSATEFDLSALEPLAGGLVEAGRSCVHPAHRNGSVITLMWSALARYTLLAGYRHLGGCASVPLADGGHAATTAWHLASTRHASPAEYRVRPYRPWLPAHRAEQPRYADLPPLLRGYLRLGAWVCGLPAHDPAFDVADFYVLLPVDQVDERYRRHLLGAGR